jgi:AcrR family transcriptional regulator
MTDVARELAVAPGTLYLYVESKAALFDFLIQRVDARPDDQALEAAPELPIRSHAADETLAHLRERMVGMRLEALASAPKSAPVDAAHELAAIVGEIYRLHAQNRRLFRLLDQSARDYPDLARVFFCEIRPKVLARLSGYLRRRIGQGALAPVPDPDLVARYLIEASYFWAVSEWWDVDHLPHDDQQREELVTQLAVSALLPKRARRAPPTVRNAGARRRAAPRSTRSR